MGIALLNHFQNISIEGVTGSWTKLYDGSISQDATKLPSFSSPGTPQNMNSILSIPIDTEEFIHGTYIYATMESSFHYNYSGTGSSTRMAYSLSRPTYGGPDTVNNTVYASSSGNPVYKLESLFYGMLYYNLQRNAWYITINLDYSICIRELSFTSHMNAYLADTTGSMRFVSHSLSGAVYIK